MWERQADRPLAGIIWMLISGIAMVGVNGAVKYVGTSLPTAQAAFLRFAVGVVIFLPMVAPILMFAASLLLARESTLAVTAINEEMDHRPGKRKPD